MENKNGIESALANLIQLSSEKGFLVFDDIYDEADKWFLSIRDVDYLSSSIVTRGIIVYDEAPVTDAAGSSEDEYDDYAQRDYEAVFNKVSVYAGEKLLYAFNVPYNRNATAWKVFDYNPSTGQLVIHNQLGDSDCGKEFGKDIQWAE